MNGLKRGLLMGCCWLGWLSLSHAQLIKEPIAPPPPTGVLDESGFFRLQPAVLERIVKQIAELKGKHAFQVYLVVEPLLFGVTIPERAHELRKRWLPAGDGVVVVYETSSSKLAIGFDILNIHELDQKSERAIPSYKTSAILNRALASSDAKKTPDVFLAKLMENLTTGFHDYFSNLTLQAPPERALKITLVIVSTFALLGLATLVAGSIVRFSSISAAQKFRFPSVESHERLAAPCGASVTTHRFGDTTQQV
jgi:hypothetical protein